MRWAVGWLGVLAACTTADATPPAAARPFCVPYHRGGRQQLVDEHGYYVALSPDGKLAALTGEGGLGPCTPDCI
jgi:hypothetical protein